MSAAKHQPATPLPQLAVQWDEAKERVSLITLGNHPHDYVLASSKDSGKGKVYERIAHAANAYPKLVEELRDLSAGVQRLQTVTKADQQAVALPVCRALALLSELGEAS